MPTPGLTYRLGPGAVELRPDGSLAAVRARAGAPGHLVGGGRVRVVVDGQEVSWPEPAVAVDIDEVEFSYAAAGLGLVVRHTFAADWGVRIAFANHTLDPLTAVADLGWVPAADGPAWALAAGATGAYAVLSPDAEGPLLGGELTLGTCDAVTESGIGLGRLELGPLQRQVVQWRWAWYAGPAAFNRNRFPAVPRDLVLPENEAVRILADEDTAVVAPGVETVRRGPHLELTAAGGHRARIEVASHRGLTAYDLEWVEPLADALTPVGEALLEGPRTRTGVVAVPGVDAALVLQHLLGRRRLSRPDQADDALGLFVTRSAEDPVLDGRGVSLLCGEFERTGDPDLLEQATAHLLRLGRPVPGLGLAAAQVCVARLSTGQSLDPVLGQLGRMVAPATGDGLDRLAADLELRLTAAPRATDEEVGLGRPVDAAVRRIGTALGAGLRGRPVRPQPVDQQAYLAVVLGLLPEVLGAGPRPDWGRSPHEVARLVQAQALARLHGQRPRAAHGWLIMGTRLA